MVSELTVIVKDAEKTLRRSFLLYEDYQVNESDPIIEDCIDQTVNEFKGVPDSVKIRINMVVN